LDLREDDRLNDNSPEIWVMVRVSEAESPVIVAVEPETVDV